MDVFEVVLTTALVIISLLLILVILIQSNRSAGMGLFGGGGASQTAFGSSSGDILTRITGIMTTAFLLITLGLAFIKSKSGDSGEERLLKNEANALKSTEKSETGQGQMTTGKATTGAAETNTTKKAEKENKPENE